MTFPRRKDVVSLVWYGLCLFIGFWMFGGAFSFLLVVVGWALGLVNDTPVTTSSQIMLVGGMVYLLAMISLLISWLRSALHLFLGQLAGRETIEIQANTLVVIDQLFGSKKVHRFLLTHIKHLRVAMPNPFLGQFGYIVFEYEAQKVRLGWVMSQADAQMVVATLKQSFSL